MKKKPEKPEHVMELVERHLATCDEHDDPRAASYAIALAALMQAAAHGHDLDSILATIRKHHAEQIRLAVNALKAGT